MISLKLTHTRIPIIRRHLIIHQLVITHANKVAVDDEANLVAEDREAQVAEDDHRKEAVVGRQDLEVVVDDAQQVVVAVEVHSKEAEVGDGEDEVAVEAQAAEEQKDLVVEAAADPAAMVVVGACGDSCSAPKWSDAVGIGLCLAWKPSVDIYIEMEACGNSQ